MQVSSSVRVNSRKTRKLSRRLEKSVEDKGKKKRLNWLLMKMLVKKSISKNPRCS